MSKKIHAGILFGGKSAEHEVSLQSAKNVIEAIDRDKFIPVLIGIDKEGNWYLNNEKDFLLNADDPAQISLNTDSDRVTLIPNSKGKLINLTQNTSDQYVDVVFPVLHGPFGEDGTVQGLLKLADVPFVGAGILGSSAGMDKDVMKRLLRDAGIPIAHYICVHNYKEVPNYHTAIKELGTPLFIKPANLGSSVGISKASSEQEYNKAIPLAFAFDNKIIIEKFVDGREIECAVLGNEDPKASLPGEVIAHHDFYSYEAKYLDEKGAGLEAPAKISEEETKKIQEISVKTYQILDCEGLARVDSFLTKKGEVFVNEINTIPGFTKISMYPRLWELSGIPYKELISQLIELAFQRFKNEKKLKTNYDS